MGTYKFTEVLNDLINYFLLGDLVTLKNYKKLNNLSDDLATEFTTNESGDNVVKDGILIPMSGIENYPYTILFHTSNETPELLKEGNQLQVREDGYILKIESGKLMLFTWWVLNNFTDDTVGRLIECNKPQIELEKGWYKVEILGGLTEQEKQLEIKQGENITVRGFEPTFEFIITQTENKESFTADIFKSYQLKSVDY